MGIGNARFPCSPGFFSFMQRRIRHSRAAAAIHNPPAFSLLKKQLADYEHCQYT
jgi:hypothetical protein